MNYTINCGGRLISTERPLVMGILNVTDDSFFDGGRYITSDAMERRVSQMLEDGADIIDIGAYSSRPGADDVPAETEKMRLMKALELIAAKFPGTITSIDTFRASVAECCVKEGGANIINDISAYNIEPEMLDVAANLNVPYILMHMQGVPSDMQKSPHYDKGVTDEVIKFLSSKLTELNDRGVSDVIIDPGFGFGKTLDDNYELMAHLREFQIFKRPLLVGISRKSMIYKLTNATPAESLNGTTVLNVFSLLAGADILRVHDVKECAEAVKIVGKLKEFMTTPMP